MQPKGRRNWVFRLVWWALLVGGMAFLVWPQSGMPQRLSRGTGWFPIGESKEICVPSEAIAAGTTIKGRGKDLALHQVPINRLDVKTVTECSDLTGRRALVKLLANTPVQEDQIVAVVLVQVPKYFIAAGETVTEHKFEPALLEASAIHTDTLTNVPFGLNTSNWLALENLPADEPIRRGQLDDAVTVWVPNAQIDAGRPITDGDLQKIVLAAGVVPTDALITKAGILATDRKAVVERVGLVSLPAYVPIPRSAITDAIAVQVPKEPIAAETTVSESKFVDQTLQISRVTTDTLLAADEIAKDKIAAEPLLPGQPVRETMLQDPAQAPAQPFGKTYAGAMQVVQLPVSAPGALGGSLVVGNEVTLYATPRMLNDRLRLDLVEKVNDSKLTAEVLADLEKEETSGSYRVTLGIQREDSAKLEHVFAAMPFAEFYLVLSPGG